MFHDTQIRKQKRQFKINNKYLSFPKKYNFELKQISKI